MKNLMVCLLLGIAQLSFGQAEAESNFLTKKGNWIIDTQTGLSFGIFPSSGTGGNVINSNGRTLWSVGTDLGYFAKENLAYKFGAGLISVDFDDTVGRISLGTEYYISKKFPIQIDVNGLFGSGSSLFQLGLQSGIAFYINDKAIFKPVARYNFNLKDSNNYFEIRFGFGIGIGGN